MSCLADDQRVACAEEEEANAFGRMAEVCSLAPNHIEEEHLRSEIVSNDASNEKSKEAVVAVRACDWVATRTWYKRAWRTIRGDNAGSGFTTARGENGPEASMGIAALRFRGDVLSFEILRRDDDSLVWAAWLSNEDVYCVSVTAQLVKASYATSHLMSPSWISLRRAWFVYGPLLTREALEVRPGRNVLLGCS